MTDEALTPLERALLEGFFENYRAIGFPSPDQFQVVKRENTGAGRFVDVRVDRETQLKNEPLALDDRYVEVPNVPYGMTAVVFVDGHRPALLEICVCGDFLWNGDEEGWQIIK